MGCKPTYKGVRYNSLEELYNANGVNEQQKQKAQQLYSQYLDTIFKTSKVKDIVYHGSKSDFDIFKNRQVDEEVGVMNGIYLAPNIKYAKEYGKNIKHVIINTINPLITEGSWTGIINDETKQKVLDRGYDAVINNAFDNSKFDKFLDKLKLSRTRKETIVFEPEQIHILGSKQDIEGFKKFVGNENNAPSEIGVVKDTIIKRLLKDEENSEKSITFAEINKSLGGRLSNALKGSSKTPEELWSNLSSEGKVQLIDCL